MAVQLDPSGKDDKNEVKTHFVTREGTYRSLNISAEEFVNRPRPGGGYSIQSNSNTIVHVSFVTLPLPGAAATAAAAATAQTNGANGGGGAAMGGQECPSSTTNSSATSSNLGGQERICFNVGKELYVYSFKGIKKVADLNNKPIEKKVYKGCNPSCHDFNTTAANADGAPLLIGFTTGQMQLLHPGRRDPGKLYNEERLIDKTKVNCLKWVPGSANLFLAAHASGHMYLYNEELSSQPVAPSYQPYKCGDGYAIMMCKTKTPRNPLYKWTFGNENYSINELCFSPCGANLAIVSQDGFLRVFHYSSMELVGIARSYFGGFLCVCWSPDGKYIVVGGEDDLVTIYSLHERRVVARGQGHRSWVSSVAFDPFVTSYANWESADFSDDENPVNESYHRYVNHHHHHHHHQHNNENHAEERAKKTSSISTRDSCVAPDKLISGYRLGSVGQDTQLCFWDITEDALRQIGHRPRLSSQEPLVMNGGIGCGSSVLDDVPIIKPVAATGNTSGSATTTTTCATAAAGPANDQVDACARSTTGGKLFNCTNLMIETSDSKDLMSSSDISSSKLINSTTSSKTNSLVGNCIGNNVVSASKDSLNDKSASSTLSSRHSTQGVGSDSTATLTSVGGNVQNHLHTTSNAVSSNHTSNHSASAFNTLTQKLSNLGFGSDKNNGAGKTNKKRNFTLSKSSQKQLVHHINGNNSQEPSTSTNSLTKSSKSLSSSTTTSGVMSSASGMSMIDPGKLIGSSACPRFEETPVLEPLVIKKIAHERLTALVFREDCFVTACQDGVVNTWARPGYGLQQNPQHNLSASPAAVQGGTVV